MSLVEKIVSFLFSLSGSIVFVAQILSSVLGLAIVMYVVTKATKFFRGLSWNQTSTNSQL